MIFDDSGQADEALSNILLPDSRPGHSPMMQSPFFKPHPAAAWAAQQQFTLTDIDCTTAVVLKILDGKCRMSPGEMAAIMEIYDVVRCDSGVLFSESDHQAIYQARVKPTDAVLTRVHKLRMFAESRIPEPVMKQYKSMLRDGLFG
jgi:hypothetical protein